MINFHLSSVIRLMWASLAGGWFHRGLRRKKRGLFYFTPIDQIAMR
jgi:hypothetical protein